MTENDKLAQELITKYSSIHQPTIEEKTADTIEDVLCVLQTTLKDDKKIRIAYEILFDFAIINGLNIKQKEYYQKILLDWKCTELEEKEYQNNDNNISRSQNT